MTVRLHCARLALTDFRSHAALELELGPEPICLFGANGAGKTNILEALSVLVPGRGLRGATLMDMARVDGRAERARLWSVSAEIVADGAAFMIGAGAEGGEAAPKRVARLDGAPAAAGEIAAALRMSWITPAMDRLFQGPAGERRKFLDRMTLGLSPGHGAAVAAYERAMRERQRLLQEPRPDPDWMASLERQMAVHGASLADARAALLGSLQRAIAARPEGAFPKAAIALEGGLLAGAGLESEDRAASFEERLRQSRPRDAAAGRALEGPHRSDLRVRHAAKDMPAELCSTGEQKALLIGLALAHAHALADEPEGGPALLLLDEAAAHLDPERRAALYDELAELPGQAWLTGTEQGLFSAFADRARLIGL